MDANHLRCSVCKHPVTMEPARGRRRAALIEDGLTLCNVCAWAASRSTGNTR